MHLQLVHGNKRNRSEVQPCTHLLQAISAQAYGRAISSSGLRLAEKLRDCATRDSDRLISSWGMSLACVGRIVANACSTGLLFMLTCLGSLCWDPVRRFDRELSWFWELANFSMQLRDENYCSKIV